MKLCITPFTLSVLFIFDEIVALGACFAIVFKTVIAYLVAVNTSRITIHIWAINGG
jgi:hypothetical protein